MLLLRQLLYNGTNSLPKAKQSISIARVRGEPLPWLIALGAAGYHSDNRHRTQPGTEPRPSGTSKKKPCLKLSESLLENNFGMEPSQWIRGLHPAMPSKFFVSHVLLLLCVPGGTAPASSGEHMDCHLPCKGDLMVKCALGSLARPLAAPLVSSGLRGRWFAAKRGSSQARRSPPYGICVGSLGKLPTSWHCWAGRPLVGLHMSCMKSWAGPQPPRHRALLGKGSSASCPSLS